MAFLLLNLSVPDVHFSKALGERWEISPPSLWVIFYYGLIFSCRDFVSQVRLENSVFQAQWVKQPPETLTSLMSLVQILTAPLSIQPLANAPGEAVEASPSARASAPTWRSLRIQPGPALESEWAAEDFLSSFFSLPDCCSNQCWDRSKPGTRIQELSLGFPYGWQRPKHLSHLCCFPRTLARTWTGSGAATTQISTHIGCQYHKWQFYLLCP